MRYAYESLLFPHKLFVIVDNPLIGNAQKAGSLALHIKDRSDNLIGQANTFNLLQLLFPVYFYILSVYCQRRTSCMCFT